MTIPLYGIEGTILPLYQTCKMQSENSLGAQPQLRSIDLEYGQQQLQELLFCFKKNLNREADPLFWKKRSILHMVNSPSISSVTFFPLKVTEYQLLFLQKSGVQQMQSFFAPYLSRTDRSIWKAVSSIFALHHITNMETLEKSINTLRNPETRKQICKMLKYFSKDTTTSILCLNFREGSQTFFWGWIK